MGVITVTLNVKHVIPTSLNMFSMVCPDSEVDFYNQEAREIEREEAECSAQT